MLLVNVKIEGVVGIGRIMRMPTLRLFPADDGADVFDDDLTFGNIGQSKDAFTMHTGAPGLDASRICRGSFFGHV